MNLSADQRIARTLLRQLLHPTTTRLPARQLTAAVAQHVQPLTLLTLSHTLEQLGIETLATRLPPAQLGELPCPAIAFLALGAGGCFAVVHSADARLVTWEHPEYGRLTTTTATFVHLWTGIVLMAELEERVPRLRRLIGWWRRSRR
ncbi:hypothetical protein E5K00_10075 [Hymenobacter aquaticus]|uniref:Peptidase C39 domain-containing protein n=1 Tax=Hymenobacter aquaticus TaxID=1867101 RepID=A0A4Z0Q728_9BACT|nr:cysteine peptidase family C39 domain-containing protein [Hymenobacter aquaticus]TGE25515.1 hypothetical protein E5K00_10075 [Hymenobacter aquaticus]